MRPIIYLAGAWEYREAMPELAAVAERAGWSVALRWWEGKPTSNADELAKIGTREVAAVTGSRLLLAVLPGGPGTHVEIGVAIGNQIPVALYLPAWAGELPPTPFYYLAAPAVQVCSAATLTALEGWLARRRDHD